MNVQEMKEYLSKHYGINSMDGVSMRLCTSAGWEAAGIHGSTPNTQTV